MTASKNFTLPALTALLLLASPCLRAADVTGTLIRTIDTSILNPPSPDPSGLAYLGSGNTLLACDGEVDEMPNLFAGDNLFEMTLLGNLVDTGSTTDLSRSGYSNEPVGCAFNPINGHLFISSDDDKTVYEINPGSDGQLFTADDSLTSFSTSAFGNNDPEGIAYDPAEGALYIADGLNSEVYKVLPGPDGRFDTPADNQISHFDTESLGVHDPEGIEFIAPNQLYLVGKPATQMAHIYTAGPMLRTVDITQANARKPAGLAAGPGSSDPSALNVYIADRGVDNDSDPDENDGKIYEISVPPLPTGNRAPGVAAGPDLTIILPASATLDGAVVDDGPGPITTTWSQVSGPGTATFGDTNEVDTTASFSTDGRYILHLTASDGELTASDEVEVQARQPYSAPFTTVYISSTTSDKVGDLTFANEDIIAHDTATGAWTMYFDGSDVGLDASGVDVNAFEIMKDGSILLSFKSPTTVMIDGAPTLFEVSDIVRFIPTSLGDNTAGVFEWFFDGSDVGLDTDDENIDAISFLPDGQLIISVTSRYTVPGLKGLDEDLIAFSASDLGEETNGVWSMYFDGSKLELSDGGDNEDVNGTWIDDNGDIYLTTKGAFLVDGASGGADDIFRCVPSSTGPTTACSYDFTWDGINSGLPTGTVVDGIALARAALSGDDITPPTVSLTAPAPDATVSGTVTVSADASDNSGVAGVQFYLNNNPLGAEDTTAPYAISWDTTTAANGVYTLSVVARDAAGHYSTSGSVTVTVVNAAGNTVPTTAISEPADGAAFTAGDPVTFTGTAADNEDGDLTASLNWSSSIDGALGSGGSFSTATLSAGTHTITASVTDSGSLVGSDTITVTVNAVGNTVPTTAISEPADGTAFTAGDPVTFTGTAADNEDGDLTASLNWSSSIDGAIGSGGSFSTATLSAGTHTITASVTDSGSLVGSDTITVTVNAVGGGPLPAHQWHFDETSGTTAVDSAGSNNATLTNVAWVAGNIGNAAAFNGTNAWGDAGKIDFGTSNFTVAHWVKVDTFKSFAGIFNNRDSASGNIGFHTRTDSSGTFKALIDFGAASKNLAFSNAAPGTWYHVAVSVDRAGLMKLYVNGALSGQVDIAAFSAVSLSHPDNVRLGRDQGSNYFSGAIDELHLYNSALSAEAILNLYTTAGSVPGNSVPTTAISQPADGAAFTAGDPITFTGTAADNEDGDLTASLNWSSSIDGAIGSGGSFSTSTLSAGTHTITASATDSGSLVGSDTITVTVNAAGNTVPTTAISEPADGTAFTAGDPVTFTGTAADNEDGDLTASLNWSSSIDGAIGSGGSFSTSTLSAGTHTITASATDSGSLVGSDTITVTVNAVGGGPLPAHQWHFDESSGTTAADSAGTNNATLTNVSWAAGNIGNAAAFNGTNAWGDAGKIDFGTSNFTVAHWVKVDTFKSFAGIFNNRDSASGNIGFHTRTDSSGTFKALIDFGAASKNLAFSNAVPGIWYHIAISVDRAGLMKLYVNGTLSGQVDIAAFSAVSLSHPDNVRLGRDQGSNYFSGAIDELRLYNSALSEAEILNLYNE